MDFERKLYALLMMLLLFCCRSYDDICSLLQNTFENLQEIVMENNVPKKDDLIQLSFTAIQAVNSVRHLVYYLSFLSHICYSKETAADKVRYLDQV